MWFHPLSRINGGGIYRLRPRSTYFRPYAMGGGVNGCHGLLSAANPKKHHYCFLSMDFPPLPPSVPTPVVGFPGRGYVKPHNSDRTPRAAGSAMGGGSLLGPSSVVFEK